MRQYLVGHSRQGILFLHTGRDSLHSRQKYDRSAYITARADNQVRFMDCQQFFCVSETGKQLIY